MSNLRLRFVAFVVSALVASCSACAQSAPSAPPTHWVGSWATAPMLADGNNLHLFSSVTLREIVHISLGGQQIRLRFTNEFGSDPLLVHDVRVARSAGSGATEPGSDRAVTFGGVASVQIPPGAAVFSDPVRLDAASFSDLAISFYLPPQIMRAETFHPYADQENYVAAGDVSSAISLAQPAKLASWFFFDGVDVAAGPGARAIVALGDSITDGFASTPNANRRWPDVLAARLGKDRRLAQVAVLNEGIGGNRVLNEGWGPSALSRIDRDMLAQSSVRSVIVLESINDIGHLIRLESSGELVTAPELEWGLQQIASRAHEHGLKVFGATLTPYRGAGYYSAQGEEMREAVNMWIRTSGVFDGVIDFDKIVRDPNDSTRFNPAYDSGDHLHPDDAGYKAMADGIDLALFAR